MGLFTKEQLRERSSNIIQKSYSTYDQIAGIKSPAMKFINETKEEQRKYISKTYDIFLSHSSDDAKEVIGLKLLLEDLGHSVYVDWIEDPELDRSDVTKENANALRSRMKRCKSLLYAFSENSSTSTWMPWELGYFDGIRGYVAVIPITENYKSTFKGNEYLGLYPYLDSNSIKGSGKQAIWVNESDDKYIEFNKWLLGNKPYKRN